MPSQLAWLTPDTLPAETFCRQLSIPNDPLILAAVSGALYPLTKSYNWEQYGSVTPDEIASAMLDMLDAYISQTTGDCEGSGMTCADVLACLGAAGVSLYEYPFVRKSPTTGLPEWSIDDTTYWEIETVTTTPVGTTCLASTRAAMVMDLFWQQTFVAVGELFFSALATANQFLQWVNQGLLGILYGSNAQLANAILFADFDFATYMVQSELTAQQLQDLICLLHDNATLQDDDTVTFDFEAVSDNLITALGVNPGTALTLLLAYMGGDGLNTAGQVTITDTSNCAPCAPGTWCYKFDFTVDNGGFAADPYGVYVAGSYWRAQGTASEVLLRISKTFTSTVITTVEADMEFIRAKGSAGQNLIRLYDGASQVDVVMLPTTQCEDYSRTVYSSNDISVQADKLRVSGDALYDNVCDINGTVRVYEVTLYGTGTNPFGTDNCP